MNKKLRIKIIETIMRAGEGHIPSSFSIVDIIEFEFLVYAPSYAQI